MVAGATGGTFMKIAHDSAVPECTEVPLNPTGGPAVRVIVTVTPADSV